MAIVSTTALAMILIVSGDLSERAGRLILLGLVLWAVNWWLYGRHLAHPPETAARSEAQ